LATGENILRVFNIILIVFILSAVFCFTGCEDILHPSTSDISLEWHDIKAEINLNFNFDVLAPQIDDFRFSLDKFFASPVFYIYTVHHAGELSSLMSPESYVSRLVSAVKSGDVNDISRSVLEIDSLVELLRQIDSNFSAKSQLEYFLLFFIFSMLIITIVLGMRFLYSKLEKAESREKQTHIFSREAIIAQENERKRIACDLHDTVLQDMWRLSFQIENEQAAKEQRAIMQRIRSICDTLIPPDFQRRGLINALEGLCYDFWQRTKNGGTGIECRVTAEEGLNLALLNIDKQLQCYRIVQECLSNIEKHSGACGAYVRIERQSGSAGSLLISVSDNGKGFSPPDKNSVHSLRAQGHFGLWDIFERAAFINAELNIESGASDGTVITLLIPLENERTQL